MKSLSMRAFGALVLAATTLAACSSSAPELDTTLRDSIAQAEAGDPRGLTGVSEVGAFNDPTPINLDPKPALPVSLTDADGEEVEVTDVSRIIALDISGAMTKTLISLGLGPNIVGRTVSSTEKELANLPVVTKGGHNINAEAVLSLSPTLVLVDHSVGPVEAIEQIRAAGVTVVAMEPGHSISGLKTELANLADVVGLHEDGQKLVARTEEELDKDREAIKHLVPEQPMRMAFLYARGTGGVFFILGPGSGASELIEGIGGVDVAKENGLGETTPANAEALAKLNPDVIIMMSEGLESTGGIEGLLTRPGVAETIAGQHQRVVTLPDGQALSFGPQTGEVLLRLAQAVYTGK